MEIYIKLFEVFFLYLLLVLDIVLEEKIKIDTTFITNFAANMVRQQ